ncbi:MAG: hypothetical protein WCY37_03075 [Candidatus Dojkabacteria bacterium]
MSKKIFLQTVVLPITTMIFLSFFSSVVKAEEAPLFIYEKEIIEQMGETRLPLVKSLEQIRTYQQNNADTAIRVVDDKYLDNLLEKRTPIPSPEERSEEIMALRNSKREDNRPLKDLETYLSDIEEQNPENLSERYGSLIAEIDRYQVEETQLPIAKSLDEYMPEKDAVKPSERVSSLIAEVPFYKANITENQISPTISSTTLLTEKILNTKQEEVTPDYRYSALLETVEDTPIIVNYETEDETIIAQDSTTESPKSKATSPTQEKVTSSKSANVTFSVTILPVRFVYVESGQIVKIWNNTTENDTEYVLKFLDYESNEELVETEKLTIAYFEAIQGIDVFEQGVIFERTSTTFVDNTQSSEVQFNYTATGVEEVHTFI